MEKEIKEKLKEIFVKSFNCNLEKFDFNQSRSEFENWDSLGHLQLVSEIENVFNLNFEMEEIAEINKPNDLLALIQKKQNA